MESSSSATTIQIMILYASETGNSEAISEDLHSDFLSDNSILRTTTRHVLNSHQAKKSTPSTPFDLTCKKTLKICIIIASSTGDGDMPENGHLFDRFLRSQAKAIGDRSTSTLLSHVSFAILGLGDSNYSRYQGNPRHIFDRLKQLGAQQFYEMGEADEATSLELVVEPWIAGVKGAVLEKYQQLKKLEKGEVERLLREEQEMVGQVAGEKEETEQVIIRDGVMESGRYLVVGKEEGRHVMEITLKFDDPIKRKMVDVGQAVQVYPKNSDEEVKEICEYFKWSPDKLVGNSRVSEMVRDKIDIKGQRFKVKKFMKEEIDEKAAYTLKEIVRMKLPVSLSIADLEDELPFIKPRQYSITNDPFPSATSDSHHLTFCFTLAHFTDKSLTPDFGQCSSFFQRLLTTSDTSTKIECRFSSSSSKIISFPRASLIEQKRPLVMMAHGTAIAPFLSLLRRVKAEKEQAGQVVLFYGVRDDREEFLYGQEIVKMFAEELVGQCKQTYLSVACSREMGEERELMQGVKFQKGYVQDSFKETEVRKMLREALVDEQGVLMICGNQNTFGGDVQKALCSEENGILSKEELEKLKENRRMFLELWGE